MRVLIDGHNALFALQVTGKTHEEQRHALLRLVGAVAPHAVVYFDARDAPPDAFSPASELGVKVRYCKDREADTAILEAVEDADAPLLVVSNDRELCGRAKQLGARAAAVHEFFEKASRGREGRTKLEGGAGDRVPPPGEVPRFKPSDFGLPDFVDLEDYEE